jgi:hypothetical protein
MKYGRISTASTAAEKLKYDKDTMTDEEYQYLIGVIIANGTFSVMKTIMGDRQSYRLSEIDANYFLQTILSESSWANSFFTEYQKAVPDKYRKHFIKRILEMPYQVKEMLFNRRELIRNEEEFQLYLDTFLQQQDYVGDVFARDSRYNYFVRKMSKECRQKCFEIVVSDSTRLYYCMTNILEFTEEERKIIFDVIVQKRYMTSINRILNSIQDNKHESIYLDLVDQDYIDEITSIQLMSQMTKPIQ